MSTTDTCPFCGLDPFEYVDVGEGMSVAIAMNCCGELSDYYDSHEKSFPSSKKSAMAWRKYRKSLAAAAAILAAPLAQPGTGDKEREG